MTVSEYNQTVDKFSDALFRFILKSSSNYANSQDIVQDCYEKLWLHRENVDASKAKSYLYTMAHHTLIDRLRKYKNEAITDPAKIPEESYEHGYSDLQEVLNRAIEQLSPIQKSVLLLRDFEGYSYQEIGDITGLSEAQVKVYIYRSRVFLKNYIGKPDIVV